MDSQQFENETISGVLCWIVFSNFAYTNAELVCNGVLPIDQLREHSRPTSLVWQEYPSFFLKLCMIFKYLFEWLMMVVTENTQRIENYLAFITELGDTWHKGLVLPMNPELPGIFSRILLAENSHTWILPQSLLIENGNCLICKRVENSIRNCKPYNIFQSQDDNKLSIQWRLEIYQLINLTCKRISRNWIFPCMLEVVKKAVEAHRKQQHKLLLAKKDLIELVK